MRYSFPILISTIIFFAFVSKNLLIYDELYYHTYADKLGYDHVKSLLENNKKLEWFAYSIIPIVYLTKCSLVALCLTLGVFLSTNRFEFRNMFKLAVKAEFIFLIPGIVKLGWFLFIQTRYTLPDLQYFYPLSALNIFEPDKLEPWLIYPLQVLNIFELAYLLLLAFLLSKELPELDMNRSMTVVMSGYGTGLVIWMAFVMFLTLTYT